MKEREKCKHCDGKGTVEPWENLRPMREAAGLTLGGLAAATGMSVTYLSDVERGRRNAGARVQKIYGRFVR